MQKKSVVKMALGAAISAAALLGVVGTAHAKAVPIAWDPAYGGTDFPSLGWGGDGNAFIPDACLAFSGWISNSHACSGGGMSVTGLALSFYDTASPSITVDTLSLSSPVIYEMYVQGGRLRGISSGFTAPVTSSASIASLGGTTPVWWHMAFEKELSPVGTPSVQLYWTEDSVNPICLFTGPKCTGGGSEDRAILTVVPEPATYALMLGGLVAVGAFARRRLPQ